MTLSKQDIAMLQSYFAQKPVLRAFLFGSYSRNEANTGSDLDILVDLDYSQHIGLGFASMQLELEEMLQKKVDLISSFGLSPHIAPFINRDKKLIYEK